MATELERLVTRYLYYIAVNDKGVRELLDAGNWVGEVFAFRREVPEADRYSTEDILTEMGSLWVCLRFPHIDPEDPIIRQEVQAAMAEMTVN